MPSIVSTSQFQPYGSDTAEAVARHEQEGKLGPEGCVHEVVPQAQLPVPPPDGVFLPVVKYTSDKWRLL